MAQFIELTISAEEETKTQVVNTDNIGRIYPNPQNSRQSIVELNYHSIGDAPVYLEVETPYDALRLKFL